MKQFSRYLVVAAISFVLGVTIARIPFARAAAAPLQPAAIDLMAITTADMPPPSAIFPNLHVKQLLATDCVTAQLALGNAPKHYHAGASEIQVILDGSGQEWLGERKVDLRPGMMIIIPAGTAHSGTVDTSGGKLRLVAFKTPPQAPDDIHLMP
ncbi:MAG TPA: cupin domain-containing protein [Candidatus Acidoferrum sp.]|nr:cupin domain-containing protein [Candidatus Acidoferrum sp.]